MLHMRLHHHVPHDAYTYISVAGNGFGEVECIYLTLWTSASKKIIPLSLKKSYLFVLL